MTEAATITTRSTSSNTMEVTPIVLRENTTTRLVFCPLIINENPKNPDATLKGYFVYQRKGLNDQWEHIKEHTLSTLKKGEGYSLELSSEELLKLLGDSQQIIEIHKEHGFSYKERTYQISQQNVEGIFLQIADVDNRDWVIQKLKELESSNFINLQSVIGLAKIKKMLDIWKNNSSNSQENFWQKVFEENMWVLQQVFAYPVMMLDGVTYLGGKSAKGHGAGGILTDFIGQDESTGSFAIVEIKTPTTKLVGSQYRGREEGTNVVYSPSSELSGGIVQLQNQIDEAITNFHSTLGSTYKNLTHVHPHGVLIIGKLDELDDQQKKSFFQFRKTIKEIVIITFDELFKKLNSLHRVFQNEE